VFYGSSDIPLLPEGADELRRLAAEGIYPPPGGCRFYVSGMLRTRESLRVLFGERECECIEEFREFDFGDFEMMGWEALEGRADFRNWFDDKSGETEAPGGESMRLFRERVERGAKRLLDRYKGGAEARDSIVICHGGVISAFMQHCFPGIHKNLMRWTPEPGRGYSVTLLGGTPESYTEI
jgi:alpha-ribazole phosphatase